MVQFTPVQTATWIKHILPLNALENDLFAAVLTHCCSEPEESWSNSNKPLLGQGREKGGCFSLTAT